MGYARINSARNYLLDQGAAYLYQLYDAYAPDGPSLSQVQNFKSGNHTGLYDAITFNLHGYPCVYTYRTRPISSNYLGGVSLFVRGSSNTTYYSSVAYNNYLHARKYLLEDGQGIYPKLDYKHYEENHGSNITDTLKKHVCYQAALDQMSNVTMGAAVDPAWYAVKTSGHQYDANPDDIYNTVWTPVSNLNYTPSEADRRVHLTEVKIRAWVVAGEGHYKINVSFGGGPEKNLVPQQTVSYLIPKNYSHKFDIWGGIGQSVTVKFYTKVSTAGLVHSENYNMSYEDVRWWNWTTWYPETIKPSFTGSKLLINNYRGSLYMGTVQGYIQGLENGAINKNCTFIDIQASPTTHSWEDNKLTLTRMISYKAPDGKYYTTVTKIQGDIYGTGPKDIKVDVYKPTLQPFDIDGDKWLSVVLTVPGVVTYFAIAVDAHTILEVFDVGDITHIKLQWAAIHNDVAGMLKAVGVQAWRILAIWGPVSWGMKLACIRVCLAGFLLGDLAFAISVAAGLPGWACWGNAVGAFIVGVGISLALGAKFAFFSVMGIFTVSIGTALTVIGVGFIIIGIVLFIWWVNR